jgi:uncharacterized membrane protein SpoIIM required for sporulation
VKSVAFRREREDTWVELEGLIERVERSGLSSLSPAEVSRLPIVYRATLSGLSVARAISLDASLLAYLESLGARSYVAIYSAKTHPLAAARDFVRRGFPRAVHRAWRQLALAVAVMALGGVTGLSLTRQDPVRFYALVPEEMADGRGPAATTEDLRQVLYDTRPASDLLAAFAMFLFTHNAAIGMLCFASGFAFAVPTFLLLFANGVMLGAFGALYEERGLGLEFWAWVLPHGATELFAIAVCGAAGFLLADALLFPGRHTRMQNLARHGRDAGVLVIGAVLMFLAAGLVEGVFRQVVHDPASRLVVAAASAAAWVAYLVPRPERT